MIGEIRDSETAQIAIRAAITGHLVLSTIHTNDALSTIERLMDMDVEKYLLGSALEGIIAQRLARRLCEKCRKKRPTTDFEKNLLKEILDQDIDEVYEANGCEECHNGYKGRIAIQEVLEIDQDIRDALSLNAKKDKIRELIYNRQDVKTLLEDGLDKALKGITSLEEIIKLIEVDDYIKEKKHINTNIEEENQTEQNSVFNESFETNNNYSKKSIEPKVSNKSNTSQQNTNNNEINNNYSQEKDSTSNINNSNQNDILNFDFPSDTQNTVIKEEKEGEKEEEKEEEKQPEIINNEQDKKTTNNIVDDFYDSF
jgi:hypothetical protein